MQVKCGAFHIINYKLMTELHKQIKIQASSKKNLVACMGCNRLIVE